MNSNINFFPDYNASNNFFSNSNKNEHNMHNIANNNSFSIDSKNQYTKKQYVKSLFETKLEPYNEIMNNRPKILKQKINELNKLINSLTTKKYFNSMPELTLHQLNEFKEKLKDNCPISLGEFPIKTIESFNSSTNEQMTKWCFLIYSIKSNNISKYIIQAYTKEAYKLLIAKSTILDPVLRLPLKNAILIKYQDLQIIEKILFYCKNETNKDNVILKDTINILKQQLAQTTEEYNKYSFCTRYFDAKHGCCIIY